MADFPMRIEFPIRVTRTEDSEGCDVRAEDCRGELYRLDVDCRNGMTVEVFLCRHHARTVRQVFVEV